nr:MAG TPA: hypothetical protein [Bacteriophage sp.]
MVRQIALIPASIPQLAPGVQRILLLLLSDLLKVTAPITSLYPVR